MILLTIILLIVLLFSDIELKKNLNELVIYTQNSCLNFIPNSNFRDLYEAIVCGQKHFSDKNMLETFKTSGLFHLLVVSGSHLVFLSTLFEYANFKKLVPKIAKYFLLFSFAIMTGLEPPIFRSLLFFLILELNSKKKFHWTTSDICLLTMLLCCILNKSWIYSYSLILSHAASLGLLYFSQSPVLFRHLGMYCLLFPFLLPVGATHFSSFLTNYFFASFIGLIIFPISLFCAIAPWMTPAGDFLWNCLIVCLKHVNTGSQNLAPLDISIAYFWIVLTLLHGVLLWQRK